MGSTGESLLYRQETDRQQLAGDQAPSSLLSPWPTSHPSWRSRSHPSLKLSNPTTKCACMRLCCWWSLLLCTTVASKRCTHEAGICSHKKKEESGICLDLSDDRRSGCLVTMHVSACWWGLGAVVDRRVSQYSHHPSL